jgi:bifunctional DNA-binding transcriptional regulator/antitoxin component of YhaV-PrlF toxin-antitoxin module
MKIDLDNVEYITETSLTIRGSRRRTTVPKEIVEALELRDGDRLRWILLREGNVILTKSHRSQ